MSFTNDLLTGATILGVAAIAATAMGNAPAQTAKAEPIAAPAGDVAQWFASPLAMGSVAIGMAEGNYGLFLKNGKPTLRKTANYRGHVDPGNQVRNYGFCSDQNRSRGDVARANQICVERSLKRLPQILADLKAAGIDPAKDAIALTNAVDLYNQASPVHSRKFPAALAIARKQGKTGTDAIAWARTAAFYLDGDGNLDPKRGTNRATGLLGICRREGRPVTAWQCVEMDQRRRAIAIAQAVSTFKSAKVTEAQPQ